jgi:hypothetical protein
MWNKSLLTGMFALISLLAFGQSATKTMLRLPDTGQTSDYTATYGEDSDFSINPPVFTHNGDGTVTDTVTGLMWQQTDGGEMTIENARTYCTALNLAGYADWRLPTAHESFSILNHDHANPALDASVFTTTAAEYWWTATRQANDSTKIWVTNAGGGIGNHPKSETVSAGGTKKFHVRAVRDLHTQVTLPNHFTVNSNGTVADNLTGLIWQKIPYGDSITWVQALLFADTLTTGGFTDWRLPNIKELQSINDENFIKPSVNKAVFTTIATNKYWSSTSLPNQPAKAWYLDTQYGITTYDNKTVRHYLICVRGNGSSTTGVGEAKPVQFESRAVPNPFRFSTQIEFMASGDQTGEIDIFNGPNQVVSKIMLPDMSTGMQRVPWVAANLPPGAYHYVIRLRNKIGEASISTGKLILLR